VGHAPLRQQPRQHAGHHRADADEEALHRVAGRALRRRQLVTDEGTERLHGHVERGIEQPQHACRDPQLRRVGHHQQRQCGEDRAPQEVGPAPPEPRPGAVGEMADHGLHQKSRQRRGDPQPRHLLHVRTQGLEDPADVRVLQREAELDPQEAEAHVPDLPERQLRFRGHAFRALRFARILRATACLALSRRSMADAPSGCAPERGKRRHIKVFPRSRRRITRSAHPWRGRVAHTYSLRWGTRHCPLPVPRCGIVSPPAFPAPGTPRNGERMASEHWWQGAVIYQIYPRSYMDTNGDGVGDLPGIIAKLDHVASLGVDAIWVSPFFRSPMADCGYDISDYRDVDPLFGTLDDFDRLLAKAHGLGIRVMIDQVLSHTSSEHPWFRESRMSRDNPKADWYVWADPKEDGTPPNNWMSLFGGVAWRWEPRREQYYLHNFLSSQPDLNFHNPEVREA